MKNLILVFSLAASTLLSFNALAEHDTSQPTLQQEQLEQPFSEAQLAQMLAPIALYPDSLLTHILIASTYPIEIVEADRWLKKNQSLTTDQVANSVKDYNWDPSVKALVPFQRILSRLSEDLTWTQQLGDAFLQDESRMLESIQLLRQQADQEGNLEKMANMEVSYEKNNIVIEPVEKEVVYVPYYDTRMVYGNWHWSSYPPVYWQPRHSSYVSHYNPFYWHSGIRISFNYFFSAFHWHNRHVVVINSGHKKHRYYHQRPRRLVVNGGYAKRWAHKPVHRKGVAYRSKQTRAKYGTKHIKVRETSGKTYHIVQNKMRVNSKKHISLAKPKLHKSHKTHTSYKSKKPYNRVKNKARQVNIKAAKTVSKAAFKVKPKQNASINKTGQVKTHKLPRHRTRLKMQSAKKVQTKNYKKSVHKHKVTAYKKSTSKKQHNANFKQRHKVSHQRSQRSKVTKSNR